MKKKESNVKTNAAVESGVLLGGNLAVKYLIGIISLLCVLALVYRSKPQVQTMLSAGEIASSDIRAQVDFSYTDKKATESLQSQAASSVPAIYYIDEKVKDDAENEINELFKFFQETPDTSSVKDKFAWMDDDINTKILQQVSNKEQIQQNVLKLCGEYFDKGIITYSAKIRAISSGKDTLMLFDPVTKNTSEANVDRFVVDDELDPVLEGRLKLFHPFDRHLRQAVKYVLLKQLKPNVLYDYDEMERQKEIAVKSITPVRRDIKEGQIIIRRGDPVTETQRMMLGAQDEKLNETMPVFSQWNIIGNILLVAIFFIILVTYLQYHQPEIFRSNKRLLLLSIIIISTLGLVRAVLCLPINADKPLLEYFILVPMGAMLIAILMDKELAILSSMIISILVAIFAGRSVPYTVILLFGSIVAIQTTTNILHRWKFIMVGFFIGIANAMAIIMVNLLNLYSADLLSWRLIAYQSLGGFISGFVCAMVVDIYMPVLEKVFNITTDMRLLELSDLNHPLLKMMITEAPGTYHHSIMVSNMAEDAASAIGANSLMAKVGGYFHDIGKVAKPEYFAENTWFEQESRHEKLFPTMSNLVITAHVKDGVQLARKYRLPNVILDIIKEHHGTSLVYYFYKKAEKAQAEEGGEISETDFRYLGPKPHTKEAGIILLADAIEAASHTLVKPTPGKIEELVKEISGEKMDDGQLDECGLTLKDINTIRERFSHILTGILHKRIEYPEKTTNGKR